jgi:ribulose-5-phosphate 4-epimerase/fuculose-1-phosphate aldolase
MKPHTITYGNGQVIRLDDSDTFLVHSSQLALGELYPPTLFVTDISEERIKFDFYKAYKNAENVIMHCEYRSTSNDFKLIINTQ